MEARIKPMPNIGKNPKNQLSLGYWNALETEWLIRKIRML